MPAVNHRRHLPRHRAGITPAVVLTLQREEPARRLVPVASQTALVLPAAIPAAGAESDLLTLVEKSDAGLKASDPVPHTHISGDWARSRRVAIRITER